MTTPIVLFSAYDLSGECLSDGNGYVMKFDKLTAWLTALQVQSAHKWNADQICVGNLHLAKL